jgi:quercetin dioxygenase-like cupin family protein
MAMRTRPLFLARTVVVLAALFSWTIARGDGTDRAVETTTLLRRQALSDAPGKEVVMVVVSYGAGQASTPHLHRGWVFAYVLEGEVVSQLEGQPPVTYREGQSWVETPGARHLMSRNASASATARLLVWLLVDEGMPLKERCRSSRPDEGCSWRTDSPSRHQAL